MSVAQIPGEPAAQQPRFRSHHHPSPLPPPDRYGTMGAVLSTAITLAAVCAILMRLCSLPAAKVCRPKRRVLIKLWEGFCSFLTKVHGTAREA